MDVSNHVGLSGLLALERRLNTVAHNIANASTAGFRAEQVKFTARVTGETEPVHYASTGASYLSRSAGPLKPTGNPLDIAARGNAWFAIETPSGRVYTRDGRLQMTADGSLTTTTGHPVLDVGGAALRVDPRGGPLSIASDGMITQNGRQRGAIGLFRISEISRLERRDTSGIVPDIEPEPIIDFADAGIVQGHIEGANVNPTLQIIQLITISRSFESISASLDANAVSHKSAIRTLGSPS